MPQNRALLHKVEHIPELVNQDPVLVRRGRLFNDTFLLGVGEDEFLIRVIDGRIASLEKGPLVMRPWTFGLRADADTWTKFWAPVPPPGFHDIFALLRKGRITLEGNLQPLMAHLLYLKLLLAAPRRHEAGT